MSRHLLTLIAPGRPRELGGFESAFIYVLAAVTCSVFIAVAYGYYINGMLLMYAFLGVVLAVSFLTLNANPLRPRTGSWFGWIAAALSLAVAIYFMIRDPYYEARLPMVDELSLADQIAGILAVVLILEATRRVIGFTLVVVVLVFLAYGVFGQYIQGPFYHRALSLQEMLDQLVFTTNGVFGSALHVAAFLVFVFVTFGALLDRCGGGDFFFDLANSLVGKQVGGPAKVAVVSSGLYGSISGSPTADVVTTGAFTIPMMIRTGLSPVYAGAVEATASTGGALLPPVMGTAAFLMSDFTGIPYGTIAIAAVAPALLYYLSIFLAVHGHAHITGLKPSATADTPRFLSVLRRDWYYFVPIAILIWFVLAYDRAVFSAALALAALVPITLWRTRSPGKTGTAILSAFDDALRRMTGIGVACAVAGLVVGTLAMTDLTGKISSAMFVLAKGNEVLTLIIATVVVIVLGMGMPTPAVYALAAVLAAPALLALDVPMLPAHLFIVYFASMSAITPPVAVAAFAAGSIARANPMAIGLLCCRLAIVAFIIPFVFIYHPGLLLIGSPQTIALDLASATLAVIALVAATEGYLFVPLQPLMRALFGVAGLLLITTRLIPASIGLALLVALSLWLWSGRRVLARWGGSKV
ncbi:MAG TPA: TRAP transporter fused permease subunit [Pseudolabrys sp.]|uniref:TRAP transporter permease n=1 Tax=Pseudolabrys sp. TaxID=1960880 RepID=UPI002DDCF178|nr:TRAP transporter fused permease subunit [Pseudolabrys sp.]HEV2627162.1 TRAP transporter fused permease subunit [Pseudolabrys sp.]